MLQIDPGYDPCPADFDDDGTVGIADLLALLADWGQSSTPTDLNHEGDVNVQDPLMLLDDWGACP